MPKIVILGGGESGVGTAILAQKKGYDVFLSDYGKISEKYQKVLASYNINWEDQKHTESLILDADLVMKSPGIPDKVSIVKLINEKEIPIISEIEFASQFTNATIVGITGSNGKTTTTMLIYHIFKNAGLNVAMGGNIGKSFAWQVAEKEVDYYVLELSSFQLDGCYKFRPHIAIITNISPDHLDRYDYNYDNYINSKFRITQSQTKDDYLIYEFDDEASKKWLENNKVNAQLVPFSLVNKIENGAYLNNTNMEVNINNEFFSMETSIMSLDGKHNYKNIMAASNAASLVNIRKEKIRESLSNFQEVPHRLEKVAKVQDVLYINDSKATNVNSTYYALEEMKAPTIWIVGGVDKGNDYISLLPFVNEKVKAIICLGIDNKKVIDTFGSVVDIMVEVNNMKDAVKTAKHLSEKGDIVLLSPCCASFDLFESYEDRGNQFINEVKNLQ